MGFQRENVDFVLYTCLTFSAIELLSRFHHLGINNDIIFDLGSDKLSRGNIIQIHQHDPRRWHPINIRAESKIDKSLALGPSIWLVFTILCN